MSKIAAVVSILILGTQALAQSQEMRPADAIRAIRQELHGYASLNGVSGSQSCKIQALKLESSAGGLQVRIVDSRGSVTAAEISSQSQTSTFTRRVSGGVIVAYRVVNNDILSLVQVTRHEDSPDFDLTIVANGNLRTLKSCSYRE